MKKTIVLVVAMVLLVVMAFMLVGCASKPEDKIIGVWEAEWGYFREQDSTEVYCDGTLIFDDEGVLIERIHYSFVRENGDYDERVQEVTYEYTLADGILEAKYKWYEPYVMKAEIKGKELHLECYGIKEPFLTFEGEELVWKKVDDNG